MNPMGSFFLGAGEVHAPHGFILPEGWWGPWPPSVDSSWRPTRPEYCHQKQQQFLTFKLGRCQVLLGIAGVESDLLGFLKLTGTCTARHGTGRAESGWIGFDWVGLDWVGSGWVGLAAPIRSS